MELFITVVVCFFAGMGAGLGTGLAGLSAAAVITPMLVTFLDFSAYSAVGIALASDVLASAVSAYTYGKKGNLDIKNGSVMLAAVLVFTLTGSFVASFLPDSTMGSFSKFMTLLLGIKFILKPVMTQGEKREGFSVRKQLVLSVSFGSLIGFICGFIGAGGGMMLLLVLTGVLGYDLKRAVGTSVFIMTFTALTGAGSHFVIDRAMPDLVVLSLCVIFTLLWARVGAAWANRADVKRMNRVTGVVLVVLGIFMLLF